MMAIDSLQTLDIMPNQHFQQIPQPILIYKKLIFIQATMGVLTLIATKQWLGLFKKLVNLQL
jgi:hypothetical protein